MRYRASVRAVISWLDARSTKAINGIALSLLGVISLFDYATPPQISTFVLYVAPIGVAAWFGGRTSGLAVALLSAGAWSAKDVMFRGGPYTEPGILFWNTAARLMTFTLVAWLIARVHLDLRREQALARFDTLTGLLNARAFREAMDAELARAARAQHEVSLAYVDLDNFKSVNDQQGYAEGDRALGTVARVIRDALRHTDVIGRVGGDEFAVLLPATDADATRTVLSHVQSSVRKAMTQHRWPITVSIGAITCPRPSATADGLLRAADALMYEAKASGKDAFRHRTWTTGAREFTHSLEVSHDSSVRNGTSTTKSLP